MEGLPRIPPSVGEEHMVVLFHGLAKNPEKGKKVIASASRMNRVIHDLALTLMKCLVAHGPAAFVLHLDSRGRRPLRAWLVDVLKTELRDVPPSTRRQATEDISSLVTRKMTMRQWMRSCVGPCKRDLSGVGRRIARAAIRCAIAVRDADLPVPDDVIRSLRDRKVLARNVAVTTCAAFAEAIYDRATPVSLSVHSDVVCKGIMLVCMAFMCRFEDELSIRVLVTSLRDLVSDINDRVERD